MIPKIVDEAAPEATVRAIDGQRVLDDPHARVMRAIAKHHCRATFEANAERIRHFVGRMAILGRSPADTVLVVLHVDDPLGGLLAGVLMPNHDWAPIRAEGARPFARGLVVRKGIQAMLDDVDAEAGEQLRRLDRQAAVVVVDFGAVAVFEAGSGATGP